MANKDEKIMIRVDNILKIAIDESANKRNIKGAEFIREAIEEKIAREINLKKLSEIHQTESARYIFLMQTIYDKKHKDIPIEENESLELMELQDKVLFYRRLIDAYARIVTK